MTFGRTLQELTRLCGVKRCNLADALGYDPSYISRWINGVKHPSLRSNDALPAQIAAYLTANAAPDVRARIAGQFDLRCDAADDAGFSAALASLLADTIAADRAVDPARPQPTGAENAALSPVKDIALFPEGIFMALQQAPSSARLDMICTMPIHIQFKNNDAFFRRVRGILSAGTALRVVQFVDMEDVSARTDSFCRSLCYLMGLGRRIRYEFYEFRASRTGDVYLIRDALMLQYLREPFSREVYLLESADPALVGRYCAAADAYIRDRLPLAQAPDLQPLRRRQYFLDYFTQPHGRCLLRYMQPFFLPESLQEQFLAQHPELGQELQLFLGSAEFFETIFLYQLALVDYIDTGRLRFLGTVIDVPPEARREHLRSMIDQLRQAPERLCILCTQNRVCNYDDGVRVRQPARRLHARRRGRWRAAGLHRRIRRNRAPAQYLDGPLPKAPGRTAADRAGRHRLSHPLHAPFVSRSGPTDKETAPCATPPSATSSAGSSISCCTA